MSIKYFEADFIVRDPHLMGDFEKAVMGIDEDLFEAELSTDVGALWKAVPGSTGDDFASKAETQDAEIGPSESDDATAEFGRQHSEAERKTDDISGAEKQQAEESTTETAIQFVGTRSQLVVVLLRAAIVTVLDSRTDPTDEDKFEAKVLIRFLNRFLQNELIEEDFFGVVDAVGTADVNRKVNTMFGFKFADRNIFDADDGGE